MKGVLEWVKSHLLIVIFGAVIVLVPVGGVVGSIIWNGSLKTGFEESSNEWNRSLRSASTVNYSVPPLLEGEEPLSQSTAPNSALTEIYRAERERREAEAAEAAERLVSLSSRGRVPLVEGLFPEGGPERTVRPLIAGLRRVLVGGGSGYDALFDEINAGGPPLVSRVREQLEDARLRRSDDLLSGQPDDAVLTPEQESQIREELGERRYGIYRSRAQDLNVYGDPRSVLATGSEGPGPFSLTPFDAEDRSVSVGEAFVWQWDYWIVGDLLRAVDRTNTVDGVRLDVRRAPVKRIVSIRLSKVDLPAEQGAGLGASPSPFGSRDARPTPRIGGGQPAGAPVGPVPSHTRRAAGGGPEGAYDVRRVVLVVDAESGSLASLMSEISGDGFVTVVGVEAESVDRLSLLAQGYDYGEDNHVVRAIIEIESAAARGWLEPLMPDQVRAAYGLPPRPVETEDGFDG
ncbi:MAG: hypothetical protein AAFR38_01995 [Planctomycetota bacterium]